MESPIMNDIEQVEWLGSLLDYKKQQLKNVLEVTKAINENVPANDLYHLFQQIICQNLSVSELALFVNDHTWHRVVWKSDQLPGTIIHIPKALEYKEPSRIKPQDQKYLGGFTYIVPVFHKQQALSFALLGAMNDGLEIEEEEMLAYAQTISNIITVAVENKRLFKRELEKKQFDKELELASKVQNMLIPNKLPKNHMYEFAGLYLPHKSIGGDYYDVINVNKDEFIFCIGDISGKGIAAALVMANLQAYLNASVTFNIHGKELIDKLNSKIFSITNGENFITLFLAKYNILTRELIYLNAGHNPPILINGNEICLLEKGCTLLGMFDEIPNVQIGKLTLDPGATIINYTDGLTELEDEQGEMYGSERLMEFTKRNHRFGPEIFIKILYDSISKFKGECLFNDDVSVLVAKFL